MGRFDLENPERPIPLYYAPRDWVWLGGTGCVNHVTVVDGDGGMGARFEVGFLSGNKGGGFDEVDVGRPELGDDPSV